MAKREMAYACFADALVLTNMAEIEKAAAKLTSSKIKKVSRHRGICIFKYCIMVHSMRATAQRVSIF